MKNGIISQTVAILAENQSIHLTIMDAALSTYFSR